MTFARSSHVRKTSSPAGLSPQQSGGRGRSEPHSPHFRAHNRDGNAAREHDPSRLADAVALQPIAALLGDLTRQSRFEFSAATSVVSLQAARGASRKSCRFLL